MKVKIFNGLCSKTYPEFEKEINDFLSNFAEIKKISFTQLQNNIVLCCYEGETWEAYRDRMRRTFAANDAISSNYDQMRDSYQQGEISDLF
jgi:hypothetical protein